MGHRYGKKDGRERSDVRGFCERGVSGAYLLAGEGANDTGEWETTC